ncbi:MAG: ATP-binding cassette domain-containing protein [Bacillota bacterium]|nr:ATP-binding cassette domain-containing protein [Bacillota bacterium]
MNIIEVSGLKKSYGATEAVKGIDFTVRQGSLYAFLGPNGAGKSTTIDILCTLLKPDAGNVTIDGMVLGKNDASIRNVIGVVFQSSILDKLLTVRENLMTRGSFYGLSGLELRQRTAKAAEAAGVTEYINRPYGRLSGGQRRRADIARALINSPKLLFLDEPTTGLDPQTRRNVWETIRNMQKSTGMTVFLTTHYMEEAANADYVTIIDGGRISVCGTPTELKEKYCRDSLRIKPKDMGAFIRAIDGQSLEYKIEGEICTIPLKNTVCAIPVINSLKEYIENFEVINGTLDDAFINVTGKEIRDA